MIDSVVVAWALGSPALLPARLRRRCRGTCPRRGTSPPTWWSRALVYVMKCLPILRGARPQGGGARARARRPPAAARRRRRSSSRKAAAAAAGASSAEAAAYGVGRIVKAVPGCRVLCVYLRGDGQDDVLRRARARRALPRARSPCSSRRSDARRAARLARDRAPDRGQARRDGAARSMLGDDVVDLADPETAEHALHPRFDARAFAPRERAALARGIRSPSRSAGRSGRRRRRRTRPRAAATPPCASIPREFAVEGDVVTPRRPAATASRLTRARERSARRRRARGRRRAASSSGVRSGSLPARQPGRAPRAASRSRAAAKLLGCAPGELAIASAARVPHLLRGGAPTRPRALALAPRPLRGLRDSPSARSAA